MGVRMKSRRGRGGGIENVRFDNWVMRDVGQAINVTNYYLMEGEVRREAPEPVSNRTPVFRDIAISNISIRGARVAINVEGLPEMPITGLRISNLVATAKTGMKAFHTSAMELHNAGTGYRRRGQVKVRRRCPAGYCQLSIIGCEKISSGMPCPTAASLVQIQYSACQCSWRS
jgi:hypothetical protein